LIVLWVLVTIVCLQTSGYTFMQKLCSDHYIYCNRKWMLYCAVLLLISAECLRWACGFNVRTAHNLPIFKIDSDIFRYKLFQNSCTGMQQLHYILETECIIVLQYFCDSCYTLPVYSTLCPNKAGLLLHFQIPPTNLHRC